MGRVAAFAALLVGVFAGAALLGGAIDPAGSDADVETGEHRSTGAGTTDTHAGDESAEAPPGLQTAQGGYRLILNRTRLTEGRPRARIDFRIVDRAGWPLHEFERSHEKRMHFIVVRRDLSSFQHLHPTMGPDGTWSARVDLSEGGVYRVFADFTRDGDQRTLGADVHVGDRYRPEALAQPRPTAQTERGLTVTLDSDGVRAGAAGRVGFQVRDGGEPVNDRLEPYLGAKGHLVALREGDLAYLHTHPEGGELAFMTEYPSAGAYRLFVQFRYQGKVHTAAFTQQVPR
jgi:hypothetical protein